MLGDEIMNKINQLCKAAATEGTVMLKNTGGVLPLEKGTHLAVFGRMQTAYYESGTGSGGGVLLEEKPTIIKALAENSDIELDQELVKIYNDWVLENPFDDGGGVWAGEPWHQKEMPLSEGIVKTTALKNEVALVIIGRTAGEDHDNADVKGSYRLTDDEEQMLSLVCENFKKVVVAINCGNVIDLTFIDTFESIKSVLYIWQGGMEGTNAFSEILSGRAYPSGKLSDTQLYTLNGHPAEASFGNGEEIIYNEDIYVGYRYFETFAPNEVRYPFGFGLGYTDFEISYNAEIKNDKVIIVANVKNVGSFAGKEVVQIYYSAPDGSLGNPAKQLVEFVKTKELLPNESQVIEISFPLSRMASFDESGVTGNKSCMVLLKGDYCIFAGTDVRSTKNIITYNCLENKVIEKLNTALAPCCDFKVIKAEGDNQERKISYREIIGVPTKIEEQRKRNTFKELEYTGNKNIKLVDVYNGKNTIEEFVAQLDDLELVSLVCGEGMNSPKATHGVAGALGGQTEALSNYGIPVCCVADGPSGIKKNDVATTLAPNGTMLACTWNTDIVCNLFALIGKELEELQIDSLLGPGLNIHRYPLCGRNFEYFSEDPYLSGKIGAYITKGIAKHGGYSTIKHFCCNNQEKRRSFYNVVVSERALREIYLKPFEIAVNEGENILIMTSYNSVNGFWCASSYDLTTTILRDEWNFENLVMTDWWANCNTEQGQMGNRESLDGMVRAQNDVYMVCEDARVKSYSVQAGLKSGSLLKNELQRSCVNICKWILKSNTFKDYIKRGCVNRYPVVLTADDFSVVEVIENPNANMDYNIKIKSGGNTAFVFKISSKFDALSQLPVTVKVDSSQFSFTINGTNGQEIEVTRFVKADWCGENAHYMKVSFSNAVNISSIIIKQKK